MKKISISIFFSFLTFLSLTANNGTGQSEEKYCAKLKDGVITVMYQGSHVTSDVTLDNGIVLKTDGTVIKKNGSKTTLKDGECIHKDGTISTKENKKVSKK
jgi:hypothetical protein